MFNLLLALRTIRSNLLRSILTIFIIALGITALIGILTSIEVIKQALTSNFSALGANSFLINNNILVSKKTKGGMHITSVAKKNISYEEAKAFKNSFKEKPAKVGISFEGSGISTIQYNDKKTSPNITIIGADDQYFTISNTLLTIGRTFSVNELNAANNVCILGNGVAQKLFKNQFNSALNKSVLIDGVSCLVIGIAAEKGGSMMMNSDNSLILPLNTARNLLGGNNSYDITVSANQINQKSLLVDEATGLFRTIRKITLGAENNFAISQNDSITDMLMENIKYVRYASLMIAIITLLGSVIGLMNIMMVSVSERTREIGISKALGAKSSVIRKQFLTESILISLMGGALGIVLGIGVGNLVGLQFKIGFIIPWVAILLGFSLCALVGICSGIYPALKASKLDPIVALRYE